MITPELLERINSLARKKRTQGLNEEEAREQAMLRRQYLDSIKAQVTSLLDNIEVVDAPGQGHPGCLHQTQITLGTKKFH